VRDRRGGERLGEGDGVRFGDFSLSPPDVPILPEDAGERPQGGGEAIVRRWSLSPDSDAN